MAEPNAQNALAQHALALRTGRLDDAKRGFQTLTEQASHETAARPGLARAAFALGDLRAAVLAWQRVQSLAPQSWQRLNDPASAWTELRDFEHAEAAFTQAEALNTTAPIIPLTSRGSICSAERALVTTAAYLRRQPGHSGARTLEALCRIGVGNEAGALGLLDYACFVATSTIVTPKGYSTVSDFNAALSEHALNHPSLLSAPLSHATSQGLHSVRRWSDRAAQSKPSRTRSARRPAGTCASSASRGDRPGLQHRPRAVFVRNVVCHTAHWRSPNPPHPPRSLASRACATPKFQPASGQAARNPAFEAAGPTHRHRLRSRAVAVGPAATKS